ncbi:MAG: GNAT family N-acetyltransferase [Victivallaceae bacterium]|nr:GNAT family N-acetyltransferase [Victivallaceae bacterium]
MITELGTVKLKTGENLSVKCVEPPEAVYNEKLRRFLEHKGDSSMRDICERLNGNYTEFCIDKYFTGEIAGNIAAQMWYGISLKTGMGNFGHVYTEPEHRKKGIVNELMGFLIEDFQNSPGKALFCGTGSPWIADIYRKYGFQLIKQGADYGPMVLTKQNYAENFNELEKKYFAPDLSFTVRIADPGDQFDCDKVLGYSKGIRELASPRIFLSAQIPTFMEAMFRVKDKKGLVTVAETSIGSIVGWSFVLNLGSPDEQEAKVFDFMIHPNYSKQAEQFIKQSTQLAIDRGITKIYSYVCSNESKKIKNLLGAGFIEVARIHNYCMRGNKNCDLLIFSADSGNYNCKKMKVAEI